MAAVLLAIPPRDLTIGALESAATMLTDRGALEYADGESAGEELSAWLRLVVGPGGRRAWLDVDMEAMGRHQSQAMSAQGAQSRA